MGIDVTFVNTVDLVETSAAFKPNTAVSFFLFQIFLNVQKIQCAKLNCLDGVARADNQSNIENHRYTSC